MRIGNYVLVLLCFNFLLHVSAQSTHPAEVDALWAVKRKLVDTKNYLKSWRKGDPCSSYWTGVLCFDEVGSDGHLHIQELHMMNMNLSGSLAPELGQLSYLENLDFMWNQITGSIPKEIGNISTLKLLVLNGNQLSGSLPDELGLLSNLNRLQLDENNLSGTIPKSFANLSSIEHFHLNNNSFSGQLPHELSRLPHLYHLLLDNNNLSGNLPSQYSALAELRILQLDNNNFAGAEIPESYQTLSKMVKISLRNCSLGGAIPDFSNMPDLSYIDLSWNELTGFIPSKKLSSNITTIDLSNNKLNGSIPENISDLPSLQKLSLENNSLSGSVPARFWHKPLNGSAMMSIDLRYNTFSDISGDLNPPKNVNLRLRGNPVCNDANIQNLHYFCDSDDGGNWTADGLTTPTPCPVTTCPVDQYYEPIPAAPICFCAAPIRIGYRLKSPSFSYFPPYIFAFESYITQALNMEVYQLFIDSYVWEEGPRLRMNLKLFPHINSSHVFNASEVHLIKKKYTTWHFPGSELFGPYELLNFTLVGPYMPVNSGIGSGGIKKGLLAAILVSVVVFSVVASVAFMYLIFRRKNRDHHMSRRKSSVRMSIKFDGIKEFTFKEISKATNRFDSLAQIGHGGYGKVYRGILADETAIAVKRAEEGSLQGTREFLTEIQLLSRLHHRNLVQLLGYCGENGEQILVYEFMPNGSLREWIYGKHERRLNFVMRLRIALGAANGILYLHREADPPIFHRDIKPSNILLDSNLTAKVADFGLSRLAPVLDDEGGLPHHVSTVVKGTPGYLDPEYFLTRELTDKSDVYSLGVVLLELLTGIPPISHGKNLVREVKEAHKSGSWSSITDKGFVDCPPECVERFTDLAVRCCQDKPDMRPSMLAVVRELENLFQIIPESMTMSDTTSVLSSSASSSLSLANASKYTRSSTYMSGSNLISGVTGVTSPITPR